MIGIYKITSPSKREASIAGDVPFSTLWRRVTTDMSHKTSFKLV